MEQNFKRQKVLDWRSEKTEKNIVSDIDHRGQENARKDPWEDLAQKKQEIKDMMRTRGPEGQRSGIRDQRVQKNRGPEDLTT
jgi:DNA phosphorothioation-dependent restriction protein DptG